MVFEIGVIIYLTCTLVFVMIHSILLIDMHTNMATVAVAIAAIVSSMMMTRMMRWWM